MIRLLKAVSPVKYEVIVMRRRKLRKNLVYRVLIPHQPEAMELLRLSGFIDEAGMPANGSSRRSLANDHCRRAFLRGTFLGSGWVAGPEKQHHLEITTSATEAADTLGQMLFSCGISAARGPPGEPGPLREGSRTDHPLFLGLIGAHQALLRYEGRCASSRR